MKCLIISGGEFSKVRLSSRYDLIIACDKGYAYGKKLKIRPHIVIGDFDSIKRPRNFATIIEVEKEKDDTDTGLAVKYAIRNGYKEIDIICGLGKRLDHTIANISLLKYIAENGARGRILSDDTEILVAKDELIRIKRIKGRYISIFSMSDKSSIEYIKGTKYDVKNITLRNEYPLGVSNEFKDPYAKIKIKKGVVMICIVKGNL